MSGATMKVEGCLISEYREDKKTGEVIAELCYMGGRESVKLLDRSQKEQFSVCKQGVATLEMVPKQSIQNYKDGQFISSNWRSDFMTDFKPYKS